MWTVSSDAPIRPPLIGALRCREVPVAAWLAHILGLDDQAGPFYAFWSGFGRDITEFLIFGSVADHTSGGA